MSINWGRVIAIFLIVLGALSATINSWNAKYFGLQNATVAALVERGTFALIDQVIPGFNLVEGTETFRYKKEIYPMKQPGGTIIGAMIYAPLYKLGFTFSNHFDYVSHLITLGTSTILMALSCVIIYFFALNITKKENISIVSAILFPLSTLIWPYAGVSHHDIYGVFWGLLALYTYYLAHIHKNNNYLLLAGFFATFTLFFTMLPLTLPLVFWGMTLAEKKLKKIFILTAGMISGVLPTVIFNSLIFGNPFLPPNLAGKVSDTMPLLSIANFGSKLWFYLLSPSSALIYFSPIVVFGVIGIWKMYKNNPYLARLLTIISLLQLNHISTMETIGGYQYGPRYLLPILACLTLGISNWLSAKHTKISWGIFGVTAFYSVAVAMIGAIQTVMYPMPGPFAPLILLRQIMLGNLAEFRLWPMGMVILLAGFGLLYKENKNRDK